MQEVVENTSKSPRQNNLLGSKWGVCHHAIVNFLYFFLHKDKCEKQEEQLELKFFDKVWIFYEFLKRFVQYGPK